MGISPARKSCYTNPMIRTAPNPNPSRWELLNRYDVGNYTALRVKYHDCTNYEGKKVLVYKDLKQLPECLDPHFSDMNDVSPFARFEPTEEGWDMAQDYIHILLTGRPRF